MCPLAIWIPKAASGSTRKGAGQAEAFHHESGKARTLIAQEIMRRQFRCIAGAWIAERPAQQREPPRDRERKQPKPEQPPWQPAQLDRQRFRQKACPPRLHQRTPLHFLSASREHDARRSNASRVCGQRVHQREPGIVLRRICSASVRLSQIGPGQDFNPVSFPNGFRGRFTSTEFR